MPYYLSDIRQIQEILRNADSVVFFGGAGVSTDSGIPDFRSSDGLYSDEEDSNEYLLSRQCLLREPEKFFEFYKSNMLYPSAEPNDTHRALAKLEADGILRGVITQNIDGLHQAAGSETVIELHGTVQENYCTTCGEQYDLDFMLNADGIPRCPICGGVVRPNVVLYGEGLDGDSFMAAEDMIAEADVLIVGGTSLVVNPAASLVSQFRGEHLIIINYSPTPYDGLAEYVIQDSLADVFNSILDEL
jgi:NAD-dependent deacetylase